MINDPSEALLTKSDVCAKLSISLRTLESLVKRGSFPPPVRIGKYVYWSALAIQKWKALLFSDQERWQPGLSK